MKKRTRKHVFAGIFLFGERKQCMFVNILSLVPATALVLSCSVSAANVQPPKAATASAATTASPVALSAAPAPGPGKEMATSEQKLPAPIAAMLARGHNVKIVDRFAVPGTTMTGWAMVSGPYKRIYYTPADGSVAILGLMFDSNLNNVTLEHTASAQAKMNAPAPFETGPSVTSALEAAKNAPASHSEGKGREVYVVYDPACPHCHQLWLDTRGVLDKVRITWLPVAKVSQNSAGLAQALLSSADRNAAMQMAVDRKLVAAQVVAPNTQLLLQKNASILDIAGKKNVPMILFVDKGVPSLVLGTPKADVLKRIVNE